MNKYILFLLLTITGLIVSFGFTGLIFTATAQASDSNSSSDNTSIGKSTTVTGHFSDQATDLTPDWAIICSNDTTGMNEEFYLRFEPIYSASEYHLQIAKYSHFRNIVIDTGTFLPESPISPGFFVPADRLEGGHTYYWRVRARLEAIEPYVFNNWSEWSEIKSITVKTSIYAGKRGFVPSRVQILYPINGDIGTRINPTSFTWSPYKESTKYRFELGRNATMADVIVDVNVDSKTYTYEGELEHNHQYFWRVMALEPAPSDWSVTFSFQTEAAPSISPTQPGLQKDTPQPETPFWAWVVIIVGLILLIVIIVLIFRARRR
ncbi:MAG: hypothetical protein JSV54_01115 [Chloroflexota bacterium]|nr:MAG: hypothetical protein JSV54_01115 [Chloroflexota bacterium]